MSNSDSRRPKADGASDAALVRRNSDARFEAEEVIISGNRAVVPWLYHKMRNNQPWHLRGVDIFTVRDGKIAAKLAYVKG